MQAMTRSDKKRGGGAEWEEEEWGEEEEEDDVPALPEKGERHLALGVGWGVKGVEGLGCVWRWLCHACPPPTPSPKHRPQASALRTYLLANSLRAHSLTGAAPKPVLSSFDSSKFSLSF